MFSARLLSLLPQARISIIVSVVARWLALLFQVVLFAWIGALVGGSSFGFLLSDGLYVPVLCTIGFVAFLMLANWSAARAGSVAGTRLSQMIFAHVMNLGAACARVMNDAEITTLMGQGVELLRPYFSKYVPQFFYAVLAPVTLFVVVATFDLPAAIVLLICVPLMPASIMILMSRAKKFLGAYWGTYVDLGGAFLDAVQGLTTLKVFGTDARAHERLDAQAEEFRQITMKLLRTQLQSVTFMDLFTFGGIAAGCVAACVQVAFGSLELGNAVTVILLASSFFLPMRTFGSYFHTGMNANPVIDQVFLLLDAQVPAAGTQVIEGSQITICAQGLAFSYKDAKTEHSENQSPADSGEFQLHQVDLNIMPNSFIGIAGPSGSGKSTFASLLAGNLSGYTGSIQINGVELRDADPASIHQTVTLVSCASHVFRGSFRSNLTVAATQASDAAMWDALRRARLADFVYESGGLDAPVDANGANLSGGQRARLVFARSLLRNTPVYIFDEATANIDAESERYLLAAIQKIALSKTVIVISHRLPVLRYADEILVMDVGSVAERGTHEDLVAVGGIYRTLWDQSAQLEAFAASLIDELPDEEPDPVEQALAGMPGMMAGVMRAFMGIVQAEKYQSIGGSSTPEGHPAWIPLPNYSAGMSRENSTEQLPDDENLDEADSETSDTYMPGFMGLADATTTGEDSQAIKDAMRQIRDHMQKPQKVRVIVEPLPPAHRSTFTIVKKCFALTSNMTSRLVLSVTLGVLGWLLMVGVYAFAGAGLLCALGQLAGSPVAFMVGACACAALRGPVHYAERLLTHDCTFGTVATIRSRVFGMLRKLAPAKVEGRDAGDVISLLTSDIEILEGFYSRALVPVTAAALSLVIFAVATFCINVPVALVVTVSYVLVAGVLPALSLRATRERGAELRAYAVLMTGFLLDSLRGMPDLLAFGRAQEYAEELTEHLESMSVGEDGHARWTAFLSALPHAIALLGAAAIACLCVQQVSVGALQTPGEILLIAGYVASIETASSIADLGTSFHQVLAAADRVLDVMEEQPAVEEQADPVHPGVFESLSFDHVTFGYEEGITVVDDSTFEIPAGIFAGITGKSGVGKTTLLKLAMRFWDVQGGAVCINGTDVRDISLDDLHKLVSYMVQDTYLFQGSLRENLLVACPGATDAQMEDALAKADLLDNVRSWPEGLDKEVSQGVSDGERQRIGLARAFLHDAPLFLLDEPTSNLDALSEAAILMSLCQYASDKTVLIVSHRRAVAAILDKLLVVE